MEIADVDAFGREYILSKKKEKIAYNNQKRTACFGSSFLRNIVYCVIKPIVSKVLNISFP